MKNYKILQNLIYFLEADAKQFYEGGKNAAGTCLRKVMLDNRLKTPEKRLQNFKKERIYR